MRLLLPAPIAALVATCFATDTPTAEVRAIADFLAEAPLPIRTEVAFSGANANGEDLAFDFRGRYTAPNFQAGMPAYETDGDFRFDDAGQPIVQREESLRFLLVVPTTPAPPARRSRSSGLDALLYCASTRSGRTKSSST